MSNSPSITAAHTFPVHRSRLALIALWGVQVVLAGMFLLAGGSKLAGAAAMVALFSSPAVRRQCQCSCWSGHSSSPGRAVTSSLGLCRECPECVPRQSTDLSKGSTFHDTQNRSSDPRT